MKDIFLKLSIVIALLLFVFSCTTTDSGIIDVTKKTVNVVITPTSMQTAEDDELIFSVTLDEALPSDFDMRIKVVFNDGRSKLKQVEIPKGEVTVLSSVFLPVADDYTLGFDGLSSYAKLYVVGGVLAEPVEGIQYIVTSSDEVALNVFDRVAPLDREAFSVLFDWDNPLMSDLDLYIVDSAGNYVVAAESGSRYELVKLLNVSADGDYIIRTSVYGTSQTNIPYKIFAKDSNGIQHYFEGQFDNVSAGDLIDIFSFNKTGDVITIL